MTTCTTTQTESEINLNTLDAIELQDLSQNSRQGSTKGLKLGDLEDVRGEAAPPSTAVEAKQKWNEPAINRWRVLATFWSFFVTGMNDGSYGALIGHLEEYYHLNYTVVSLVFLTPFAGYTLAAISINSVHMRFGQRGAAVIGPICHLLSYIILAIHPPYAVLVVMFIFVGFGNGLADAAWSAWMGNMSQANELCGFLHCCYAIGAAIAPLIASALFGAAGLQWYYFYYVMIAVSGIELLSLASTFWAQTGLVYRTEFPIMDSETSGRTLQAFTNKITWIFATFVFGYVGAEVSLGGWIVQYMSKIRSASSFQSNATATGFWFGMAVGRGVLGFLTGRIGEFNAVISYIAISLFLELIFWLVPSLIISSVSVAFLGIFLGPLFPTAMVFVSKLMPKHLAVGSVGFAAAFGGSGGAIFPFIVGAIAQAKGVKSLQPVILALLVVIALLWFLLRGPEKRWREAQRSLDNI